MRIRRLGIAVAFASTAMAAAVAGAADLAVKAPVVTPPVVLYNWTGCYVGGHVGGGFTDDTATNRFGNSSSRDSSGFLGGGQIGCNYQFASKWVVGAEGQGAWTSLKTTKAGTVIFPSQGVTVPSQSTVDNDFLASVTARLGYSFADPWLFYVKGGAAWTNEKVDSAFIAPLGTVGAGTAVDPSTSTTRTGWTVGPGLEWAFARNWSATVEYDYYNFGGKSLVATAPGSPSVSIANFKDAIQAVTVGVNYRF